MRRLLTLLLLLALAGCGSPDAGDDVMVTPPRDVDRGGRPTRTLPTPRPSPTPTQNIPPTAPPTITPVPTLTPASGG